MVSPIFPFYLFAFFLHAARHSQRRVCDEN